MKCPFCGEPSVRESQTYYVFRCGTIGPGINGEYDTGRVCDTRTHQRRIKAKDASFKRLSTFTAKQVLKVSMLKKLLSDTFDDTEYSNKSLLERVAPLRERWEKLK